MSETELVISGIDFPPFSSRGCQQTLLPIASGEMRRSINGNLRYLGHKNFHKYHSIVVCQDVNAPAFNHTWLGSEVTVTCAQYIWQKVEINQQEVELIRRPRLETLSIIDNLGSKITYDLVTEKKISFHKPLLHAVLIRFMPILTMRLTGFTQTNEEWNQITNWRLELEEI